MSETKLVRHKDTGQLFRAIQYGDYDRRWSKEDITDIAAFVLGVNPDNKSTVANDRLLDVVKPVYNRFDPLSGVADIDITDPATGNHTYTLELGDWIIRREGLNKNRSLAFVKAWAFVENYVDEEPVPIPESVDEVANFIYMKCMAGMEGELYQALSERIAAELHKAGWLNKEKT